MGLLPGGRGYQQPTAAGAVQLLSPIPPNQFDVLELRFLVPRWGASTEAASQPRWLSGSRPLGPVLILRNLE